MNSFAQLKRDDQRRAVVNSNAGTERVALTSFDDRSAAIVQRRLRESLNQSPMIESQLRLQQSLNRSPRVSTQAKLAHSLSDRRASPQSLIQRQAVTKEEEDETRTRPALATMQCAAIATEGTPDDDQTWQGKAAPLQRKANNTGLPDNLKTGIESLSRMAMDDVKVHYNSAEPARLQALAYTQGTNIHVGPGQEKHLAHEAWHVVQQKQGRVRATVQTKGVPLNDDSSLEREADLMGAKALQSGRENNEKAAAMTEPGTLADHPPGVLQRKLGYEFETGWTITVDNTPLSKTDKIGHDNPVGYKVESDDDGRMEFIIDPPLEISSYLIGDLNAIFERMNAFIRRLIEVRDQHREPKPKEEEEEQVFTQEEGFKSDEEEEDGGSSSSDEEEEEEFLYTPFPLSEVTGNEADDIFIVIPAADGKVRANPQITTGMTLSQVANLSSYLDQKPLKESLRTAVIQGTPKTFVPLMNNETYQKAGLNLDALGGDVSPDLKGLVTLAASYISSGERSIVDYQKMITDGFLLSRTDFAHLFYLLPERERRYFVKNSNVWVNLVLTVAGVPDTSANKIFHKGVRNKEGEIEKNFGPTRGEWLRGIVVNRVDLMSYSESEKYEGMGRLGSKTEMVSTQEDSEKLQRGGIFEIRAGQTQSLDHTEWRDFALDVAEFLRFMQPDKTGLLETNEKNRRMMAGEKF